MSEKFIITSTRQRDPQNNTNAKPMREICKIEITANSEIIDLFLEYNYNFDKWLKAKAFKEGVNYCDLCGGEIEFSDNCWRHIHTKPRHIARVRRGNISPIKRDFGT